MPWDTSALAGLAEALAAQSPFADAARGEASDSETPRPYADPLAASTAFAALTVFPSSEGGIAEEAAYELEEEEVVDALPGHALEERLRSIGDETESDEMPGGAMYEGGEAYGAPSSYDREPPYEIGEEAEDESWTDRLGGVLATGAATAKLTAAVAGGERNESTLTDMVFDVRHPGHVIKRGEAALKAEWRQIRDTIVRPLLRGEGLISAPPFAGPYDPGFVDDAALKACLTVPDDLHVALVDLTDPATPAYAGVKDEETDFGASMPKVAPLFAAFELRARLNQALATVPTTAPVPAILRNLERTWQPLMDATLPKARGAYPSFPKLSTIFTFTVDSVTDPTRPAWKVEFTTKGNIASLGSAPQAENAGFSKIDGKFGFREMLRLMASFSNNAAAGRVIAALGYEYIHGALLTAGLWEAGKGGLWVAAPFAHPPEGLRSWIPEPSMTKGHPTRRFQVGSAKAFARLFTLLAQGKLVDADSSTQMLDMLVPMTNDFIRNALDATGRGVVSMATKIGVIGGSYWCQTSFVRRDVVVAGKQIQYVLAILNNNAPFLLGADTIEPFDQCILNRHPAPPPAPAPAAGP